MSELTQWDSYYVIVGSAAGGLVGLQFVVMTLLADRPLPRADKAGPAFATPTVVHFATVLFLSAILRAPWVAIMLVATSLERCRKVRNSIDHGEGKFNELVRTLQT